MGGYSGGGGDGFTVGLQRWLGFVQVGSGGAFGFCLGVWRFLV